ncbi:L-ascorbate metabolism protein UlaG (beta-lactamase superfamily) [Aeromicrobium panaciterrae]|uniref:L-ascorbate metabolism protein UlaG (Beta-lactamase superfamily) n=1 Tax=Aeromicrobium panaciterrae TaxID=363861 RepID=A0ABU1UNZ9_9ACTN|nr:MBL fold metallo-hydrolase [Aeromicrobium panaciterrae]MDR7086910.1 L-ascorbate metabolism protein UlaG (beta-lactamase superfamily) [Aeromicrobium panaciterrae]
MQITRFGHAAVLVEAAGTRVLIDPGVFSAEEAFALEGLDAIVVTHQHPDHIDVTRSPGLLERNPNAVLIADPESAGTLAFGDWTPNADGLVTVVGDVTVRGVGSQHAVILSALPRVANVGVVLSAAGEPTLFHPGDTYEYAPEGVDVLALPLSAPWAKISETVDFVQRVSPGSLFPVHDKTISELAYGIYWQHTMNFGGVEDSRKLGQTDSDTFESA